MVKQYRNDVERIAQLPLPWEKLRGRTILVTGATGLIGTFLIDVLMYRNTVCGDGIKICGVTRNRSAAEDRFERYLDGGLSFLQWDVTKSCPLTEPYDYVIHGASNTHPRAYASDPVGTIQGNVLGLFHLMEHIKEQPGTRLLLLSSVEIYGENTGNREAFLEDDLGYLNCNTVRAGYPESKRLSESICQAYAAQYGLDVVIGRLCRIYGPTMRADDSKALAQFIRNAAAGQDIVLKSEGTQYYSYLYVADAVSAVLSLLLLGASREAYNVADAASDITLKELALMLACQAGTQLCYRLPDEQERAGYSTATRAVLDAEKLHELGWSASFSLEEGLAHTISILKTNESKEEG